MPNLPAETTPLPARLQALHDELPLPAVQGTTSQDLLLGGIGRALSLPEAVTVAQVDDSSERERFIQLTSGDKWSLRIEATERNPERVSEHVPRQSIHVYAFHYGARLLIESTIKAPSTEDESINEAWGIWGVKRPLLPSFTQAWRRRFFFLIPDSIDMEGDDNFRLFRQDPERDQIRLAITSLLADGQPDVELTNASRDYWLERGYRVLSPEPGQ